MDDLDDLQASEFVTDTEDQDSLDERIDSEQRLRNQHLWASFQNAACCITKLYKDRAQPNISPWVPFQNAASNLTTLYKDCIESQKRFARIGYQAGKRRRMRDLTKLLKKQHKTSVKQSQTLTSSDHSDNQSSILNNNTTYEDPTSGQQHNNVASILAVNQLNLDCDELPSNSMQAQQSSHQLHLQQSQHQSANTIVPQVQQQQLNPQIQLSNNEDDLVTFQQALAQPTVRGIKSSQNRRVYSNSPGYINSRTQIDHKTEEDRLSELNQFLSEEYHRHVGSRKRSCSTLGGNPIKRLRE